MLDVHLGLGTGLLTDVLRQQGPPGKSQVSLAVRAVLEELAVLAEVALRRRDVAAGLDADGAQRLRAGADRQPPVSRRARDDDVVTLPDLERPEDRLDPRPPTLDVDDLVADPVAVPGARRSGDGIGQPHVTVAEQQPAAGDDVGPLDGLGRKEVVRAQVTRQQRVVGCRGEVTDAPLAVVRHRGGDVAVVEQGGVRGEALLPHELLVVELALAAPGRASVLGVPLRGDASHRLVVRHWFVHLAVGRGSRGRVRSHPRRIGRRWHQCMLTGRQCGQVCPVKADKWWTTCPPDAAPGRRPLASVQR